MNRFAPHVGLLQHGLPRGSTALPWVLIVLLGGVSFGSNADAASPEWRTDFGKATAAAERRGAMLLVFFFDEDKQRLNRHFEEVVMTQPEIARRLKRYVCLKLPLDATIRSGGEDVELLKHPTFEPMKGRDGLAILDHQNRTAPYYQCLVSALPFEDDACHSVRQMRVILDLPPGMPQQRWKTYVSRVRLPGGPGSEASPTAEHLQWLDDYAEATQLAREKEKMLLIYFRAGRSENAVRDRFERVTLADPAVVEKLDDYVLLRLPVDAEVSIDGKQVRLLGQAAFREMLGQQGIAILDFASTGAPYYENVVSTFPMNQRHRYSPERMQVILDLPHGTLTQRTLIYAVRTHPENPASADGQFDSTLAQEATSHSQHQARIGLQGHHHWNVRFQRINSRLPAGLTACEVCAESWPGENLLEAAIECVRCWRLSSGHWSAVRAYHRIFGYDMKRGSNGVWYATGIFGRR
jgi:hypothetical protein